MDFWTLAYTKIIVFWFVGTALSLLVRSPDALDNSTKYFRKVLRDNIGIIVLIQFIVNSRIFHIGIEIVLVFITSIFAMVKAYAEVRESLEKRKLVLRFANTVLALIGAIIFGFSIQKFVGEFQSYFYLESWKGFLLPPILTTSLLLFLYPYVLFMGYESAFTRLSFGFKDEKQLEWFARCQIFKRCHVNLKKLNRVREEYISRLTGLRSKEKILETLEGVGSKAQEESLPANDIWQREESQGTGFNSETNLTEKERKKIWVDLIRATDRAEIEANIEYPMTIEEITAGFSFRNKRKIIIDNAEAEWKEVPPRSMVEIRVRRKSEGKLEFYIKAFQNGNKIAEGWMEKSWLINQELDLTENMQQNAKLSSELEEKYCSQVRKKYGINEGTEHEIFSEAIEKEWTQPELPSIEQYLSHMS